MIPNVWGGAFEVYDNDNNNNNNNNKEEEEDCSGTRRSNVEDESKTSQNKWDRASLLHQQQQHLYGGGDQQYLDEIQQGWLLAPTDQYKKKMKEENIDLGCVVCKRKMFKWIVWGVVIAFFVMALPSILATSLPTHKPKPPPPDNYTVALHKALTFFNAQKSGKLPEHNNISWRGDSGLHDGSELTDVKGGLVGGYYDAGDNTKFHFPLSFAMTMLSWSVIEYPHKYHAIGEYDHARQLIKWGTDYLLKTFNSSADKIDKIYSQVGGSNNNSEAQPNDHSCWMRPEDMDYPRPVQTTVAGPDLGGEMAAALAAASIVFQDSPSYSRKLIKGAEACFRFARDPGKRAPYSRDNPFISPYYNSTGYFDEYMWGGTWLYLATGNDSYGMLATNPGIPRNAEAFTMNPDTSVLSWDNKLPAAMLLLTRFRMFLNPGYPYETTLSQYQNVTGLNMCSYLKQFGVFNWTKGGLIELKHGQSQNLQYVANTAFLANLFADYMNATGVPGWYCGSYFFKADVLRNFATSQIDYVLGKNPAHMSYVVGFGDKYPEHVHHRAASIPHSNVRRYSCKGGFKWLNTNKPNPNTITGAMVGGPDKHDRFKDNRKLYGYTEPTMAGNAGLVAALVSLTSSGGYGVDRNLIFSGVPPLYPQSPPPPPPWKP